MNVLLVGSGAREHCIAEALTKSGRVKLYTYGKTKNPGILALSEHYEQGDVLDFSTLLDFAKKIKPDFAFIGPDDPIGAGAADALLSLDIHSVAPLATVARLESSKGFTRDLLRKYEIPGNPKFKVFLNSDGIREFLKELGENFVVKADGLMGGKGVKVAGDHLQNHESAEAFALECLEKSGRVVIEEKLIGQEFSLMSFVDGKNVVDMVPVQDHKRAYVGDKGPNTGGMGSFSAENHLLPFLRQSDIDEAHEISVKVTSALFQETGILYRGIMYGGFMAVRDGVRLIEYNARFGDPEVMNVLPILETDFVEICEAILAGTLDRTKIVFKNKATVCKYIVPEGYPDHPKAGYEIKIDTAKVPQDVRMYYASVDLKDGALYLSSSRAIAFVGIGDTIAEAEEKAQHAISTVSGPVFFRKDIGTEALLRQRIDMMRTLRAIAA